MKSHTLPSTVLTLIYLVLLWSLVGADMCSNYTLFNATGSLTIPASKLPDTNSIFEWKFSNFISESSNPDAPHVSRVRHVFKVQTEPYQNFTVSNYPITGCVISMMTFPRSYANGIHDDGTCSSVLDSACLAELITTINSTAVVISKTTNATQGASCVYIQQKMKDMDQIDNPSSCSSHWGSLFSIFLSAPDSAWLPSSDPACTTTNVNTADEKAIFKNGWTSFGSQEGDFSAYDVSLSVPTPMIVVVWGKNGDAASVDTKVVCVPANQTISAGSRNAGVVGVTGIAASASASTSATSGGVSNFVANSCVALFIALVFGLVM